MPAPAPFYEIRYTIDAEGESSQWSSWYVPSAKRLATVDERTGVAWAPIDEPRLAALAKGLKPFAQPEITSVTIGSRKITDNPASYLRLFTVESAGEAVPQGLADWEPVVFHAKGKTPWTLEQTSLFYSASNGMLQRGIEIVKLPDGMAADVRSGDSLSGGRLELPVANGALRTAGSSGATRRGEHDPAADGAGSSFGARRRRLRKRALTREGGLEPPSLVAKRCAH